MKCQERGWEKKCKTQCELRWFPGLDTQKEKLSHQVGWGYLHGKALWSRADQIISVHPLSLWSLCSMGLSVSCQQSIAHTGQLG